MLSLKHLLLTVIGVGMVSGTIVMVTSNANEAQAGSSSTTIIGGGFVSNGQNNKCGVPPTWMGKIRGKKRWVPTYVDKHRKPHAFCDRQTGIVIQRTPGEPPVPLSPCTNDVPCTWDEARYYCANLTVGDSGQKGWRLLFIQELAALVDTNSKSCTEDLLCLPDGHPFKEVKSLGYWSASTDGGNPANAWGVRFGNGVVESGFKAGLARAWCGRGASAADAY